MSDQGYITCDEEVHLPALPAPAPALAPPLFHPHPTPSSRVADWARALDETLEAQAYARRYSAGLDIPCSHGVSFGTCGQCNAIAEEEERAWKEQEREREHNRAVRAEKKARDARIRARIAEEDLAARAASALMHQKEIVAWAAVAAKNATARDQSGGEDDDW